MVASVVSAIFWGVVLLSLLVFVHEGGHYLVARAFGVRVTEFFLGMPCRVRLSHKSAKVGTEIGVTPILLGGYNRISGMENATDDLLGPALAIVMREGRVSVAVLADELGCDLDRAYGLMVTLTDWAAIRPYYDETLGETPGQRDLPAAYETLMRDPNHLTEYDRGHDFTLPGTTSAGEPHPTGLSSEELLSLERSHTYLGVGFWHRVAILVAGPLVNVVVAFFLVVFAIMGQGYTYYLDSNTIGGVEAGSFAEAAGLAAGDTITSIAGTEVTTWTELTGALSPVLAAGEDFEVTYERDGQSHTVTIDVPDGEAIELLGVYTSSATYHPTFLEASQVTIGYVGLVGSYVAQLIMPQHTMEVLEQSSSIVGISVMASEAAASGFWDLLLFAGAISLSLGFMNLLPIPPLDGGRVLIEVVQIVIRRPLSPKAQAAVTYAGLAFFLFIFIVVMRNDILRYVIGSV